MTSKISEGIRLQYHTAEKMKLFAFRFYVLYDERKCVINSKTSNKYRNKMSTMRRVEFYGASATFRTWKKVIGFFVYWVAQYCKTQLKVRFLITLNVLYPLMFMEFPQSQLHPVIFLKAWRHRLSTPTAYIGSVMTDGKLNFLLTECVAHIF